MRDSSTSSKQSSPWWAKTTSWTPTSMKTLLENCLAMKLTSCFKLTNWLISVRSNSMCLFWTPTARLLKRCTSNSTKTRPKRNVSTWILFTKCQTSRPWSTTKMKRHSVVHWLPRQQQLCSWTKRTRIQTWTYRRSEWCTHRSQALCPFISLSSIPSSSASRKKTRV